MIIKKISYLFLLAFSIGLLSSCATRFEKVRNSNDPKSILSAANEYYGQEEWLNAQALYELSIQSYRGKAEAEDIFFKYSYTYYHLGEFITASQYFKNFANTFGNSSHKEEAEYMVAYSYYRLTSNYKLDQSNSEKAIAAFEEFINTYPNSPRKEECNKLIDKMRVQMELKAFHQGLLYYKTGHYQSAAKSFEIMLRDFPGSKDEQEAKFLMIKSTYLLAENSVLEKKEERYQEVVKLCDKYLKKFTKKDFVKEGKDILEKTLKNIAKLKA